MITRLRTIIAQRKDVGSDRGVTMVELLVAVTLFAILATMIILSVTTFTGALTKDRVSNDNTNIAGIAMSELTRVVRSGTTLPQSGGDKPAFFSVKNNELVMYAYIDDASQNAQAKPIKIKFSVDPVTRELVETRWTATLVNKFWTFGTTPSSTNVLARQILVPTSSQQQIFTFYTIDPTTQLAKPMTLPAAGLTMPANEVTLNTIAVVEILVTVQSDPTARAKPVTLKNRVGIPNLGISRLGAVTP